MSLLETRGRELGAFWTADALMSAEFAEPRWAVPGLLAEGLNLLVGAPKLGKSWLCLGLGIVVASGGRALGKIEVEPGDVLYAALEDNPRRLQSRLTAVLGPEPAPSRLAMTTALGRGGQAIELLDGWLDDHPHARLIVVDTLAKVRPPSDGRQSVYEGDYAAVSALKALADQRGVCVVVVHHTRKAAADDVIDEVSGSTGLTGAADAILVAKRAGNTAEAVLSVTGRDVAESEYGMSWWAERCQWTLTDEPAMVTTMGSTRRRILAHITTNPGATPSDIADALGMNPNTVKSNVRRMVEDDQLDTTGDGRYLPRTPRATATPATGATETVAGLHPGCTPETADPCSELQQLRGLQLLDGGAA